MNVFLIFIHFCNFLKNFLMFPEKCDFINHFLQIKILNCSFERRRLGSQIIYAFSPWYHYVMARCVFFSSTCWSAFFSKLKNKISEKSHEIYFHALNFIFHYEIIRNLYFVIFSFRQLFFIFTYFSSVFKKFLNVLRDWKPGDLCIFRSSKM